MLSDTPQTLKDLGLQGLRSNAITPKGSKGKQKSVSDYNFEFQDVNEDYEGLSKINKLTELRYIASSLQDDQSSVQDEDLMLSDRYVDVGRKVEPSPNLMPS